MWVLLTSYTKYGLLAEDKAKTKKEALKHLKLDPACSIYNEETKEFIYTDKGKTKSIQYKRIPKDIKFSIEEAEYGSR